MECGIGKEYPVSFRTPDLILFYFLLNIVFDYILYLCVKEVTTMTNSVNRINNVSAHISSGINHEQDRLTINMVKPIYRM